MPQQNILIIDDEPDLLELLELTLRRMQLNVITCKTIKKAKQELANNEFHLCFTDMRLPDGNGIDLVTHIAENYPELPVAVITAYGSTETAVAALKTGAFDFVSKPIDLNDLRQMVKHALNLDKKLDKGSTQKTTSPIKAKTKLLGQSDLMQTIRTQIAKFARSQAPVYISGESGSGKELAARLIHELSSRKNGPFIAVNCGAIPSELMESEFFGHVKGSFTGAHADKPGLFQVADGGTLFLDEIADLPITMQVKLLRVLQEKSIRRVGDTKEQKIDVRVVSASHKDLQQELANGHFRQDLYYRINVIELAMPNLASRLEDIPELATFILEKISRNWELPAIKITDNTIKKLQQYSFPGNVRELENILEGAVALSDSSIIKTEHLQLNEIIINQNSTKDQKIEFTLENDKSLDDYLANIEQQIIQQTLEKCKYNKTETAKQLGISFRALRHKIGKYNLNNN